MNIMMIGQNIHPHKFTLKYPKKTMILLGYFILLLFLLFAIQDIFRDKNFYGNPIFRILLIFFALTAGFGLFYFCQNRFGKKMIFSDHGITFKKFLKIQKNISWEEISKLKFKILGFSASDAGTLASHGVLALALIPNMGEIGQWKVTIIGTDFEMKLNLYHIPFSFINYINPIVYNFSKMKYLNYQDFKNKKQKEIEWIWKLNGNEEEKKSTLDFLNDIPDNLLQEIKTRNPE